MNHPTLTLARLKELFEYDVESGLFVRAKAIRGASKGQVAGGGNGRGYIRLVIDGHGVLAHRLAWFYVHGQWPDGEIDHINRVPNDNRIENLRVATRSENLINKGLDSRNTSGVTNVTFDGKRNRWTAQVRRHGRQYNLGRFADKDQAIEVVSRFKAEQLSSPSPT